MWPRERKSYYDLVLFFKDKAFLENTSSTYTVFTAPAGTKLYKKNIRQTNISPAPPETTFSDSGKILRETEYADLVERIFELRFGVKPQECTLNKSIDYLFPSPFIAKSAHYIPSCAALPQTNNINQIDTKIPEDLSAFKLEPAVKYFVIHDTEGNKTKEDIILEYTTKEYSYDINFQGHVYIMSNGQDIVVVPYQEKARATKSEQKENHRHNQTWGACIHIELLIVIPHLEMDRGITGGHRRNRRYHTREIRI